MGTAGQRKDFFEYAYAKRWDDTVLSLILELTDPNDDAHTDDYMEKIASASEEARLIKYADLIVDTSSF